MRSIMWVLRVARTMLFHEQLAAREAMVSTTSRLFPPSGDGIAM